VEEVPSQGDVAAPAWDKIDCYSRAVTTSGRQKLCIFCVFIYRVKESLGVGHGRMGHYMDVKIQSTWVCVTEKKDLSGGVEEWGVDQQLISKLKEQYQRERQIGKKGMQSMLAFLFSCSLACCLVPCVCPPPVFLPCHMFLDSCTPYPVSCQQHVTFHCGLLVIHVRSCVVSWPYFYFGIITMAQPVSLDLAVFSYSFLFSYNFR